MVGRLALACLPALLHLLNQPSCLVGWSALDEVDLHVWFELGDDGDDAVAAAAAAAVVAVVAADVGIVAVVAVAVGAAAAGAWLVADIVVEVRDEEKSYLCESETSGQMMNETDLRGSSKPC